MTNFKSGSGNLDFGSGNENEGKSKSNEQSSDTGRADERHETDSSGQPHSESSESASTETDHSPDRQPASSEESETSKPSNRSSEKYPYFIRRSNVGDERDTRLEIHVRDKVADQEAKFRNDLAEQLGTNEVSKTDAREFALLAAFHHPERVAELMRDEGFGTL